MTTREDIAVAAKASGWVEEDPRRLPWIDTFTRTVVVDPQSKLGKLAAHQGYALREEIRVTYSAGHTGRLEGGRLFTPHDQAAIDGDFVSTSDWASGTNKKGQIIAWFAMTRNYEGE